MTEGVQGNARAAETNRISADRVETSRATRERSATTGRQEERAATNRAHLGKVALKSGSLLTPSQLDSLGVPRVLCQGWKEEGEQDKESERLRPVKKLASADETREHQGSSAHDTTTTVH